MISAIGAKSYRAIGSVGGFAMFAWQMFCWLLPGLFQLRMWRLTMPLFYEVGNRTVPVIAITGTFIGLVLANQSFTQLKSAGFEEHMGVLLSVTLMQELGPVFSAVMLAGRVGGALTAELGTMKVTDQISALSVIGTDPIRQLVVPRFLACLMMTPLLTFLCDLCGEFGGWFIAILLKGVPETPYWYNIGLRMEKWDVYVGLVKSIFFGGVIGIVSCYKGFHCRAGAEGVGRACTESFVTIFLIILMADFFIGAGMAGIYHALYGFQTFF